MIITCNIGTRNWRHPIQCPMSKMMQTRLKMRINILARLRNWIQTKRYWFYNDAASDPQIRDCRSDQPRDARDRVWKAPLMRLHPSINPFILSFINNICLLVHQITYSHIHKPIHSPVDKTLCSIINPSSHLFPNPFIQSSVKHFIHSITYQLVHLFTHSLVHSLFVHLLPLLNVSDESR